MHVHATVILGHESELVGFGLHLHRSFAGHLVIPLRSSYLRCSIIHRAANVKPSQDIKRDIFLCFVSFYCLIPIKERMNTHLDHIGIEGSTQHGRHQSDVVRVQIRLEGSGSSYMCEPVCIMEG